MSSIFVLTGENSYLLSCERKRWITEFEGKHGSENLVRINGGKISMRELQNEVATMPFIAPKRLVVMDGIPKLEKGQWSALLKIQHQDCILLCIEPKPDKRLSSVKELLQIANVQTLHPLKGIQLQEWARQFAKDCGSSLGASESVYLIATIGEDQQLLASEIEKLAIFAYERHITLKDIDTLAVLSAEQASWKILDLIAKGNTHEALQFIQLLTKKGESPYGIWSRLLWMVSQLSLVFAEVESGNVQPAAIAKSSGVPFPTAKNVLSLAKNIDRKRLQSIVSHFTKVDIALKTGGYRSTVDTPEEIECIVDRAVTVLQK